MAAVAQPYRTNQSSFMSSSSMAMGLSNGSQVAATQVQSQAQPVQQEQQAEDEFPSLFCRALYDYDAQDASALSFRRNDIIEVLTQQPSGWWDGLLGEERGWFPSNYVTIMSDEEVDLAFSGSDFSAAEGLQPPTNGQPRHSIVDMSHAMMGNSQAENEAWLDSEITNNATTSDDRNRSAWDPGASSSDFWMPQVAPNGQIFYVNTKTGQQSRDLPSEGEDEASDSDVPGLASQSSSRSGTSAGLGLGANGHVDAFGSDHESTNTSNYGAARPTGTPEPWVKKHAEDGISYYYYNQVDGSVQWTRPEPPAQPQPHAQTPAQVPIRALPQPEQQSVSTNPNSTTTLLRPTPSQQNGRRTSVYSDSSDIQPLDVDPIRMGNAPTRPRRPSIGQETVVMQLTTAERIAQTLQQSLMPSPPELLPELSAAAKESIQAVINTIQSGNPRRPDEDQKIDSLIHNVVLAIRNLLYVSAVPSGQIPSHVIPRDARDLHTNPHPQSPLKPAQRKVTAGLSRLVLSARAMQYDSGSSLTDTIRRIEVDAEELERAVLSFVLDVQRSQHNSLPPDGPDSRPPKRLRGVFMTANVGLGLVGAGSAGAWKGFGWVSTDNEADASKQVLGTEVINGLKGHISKLDAHLTSLALAARTPDDVPVSQVRLRGKDVVTQINSFLSFVSSLHVARHVDIDGIRQDASPLPNELYAKTVERARSLVRTLETAVQSLYDDVSTLFLTVQSIREGDLGPARQEREESYGYVDVLSTSLKANIAVVQQTLEGLLAVGHEQADMDQGDYNGSIEWRMSRLSLIDTQFGGAIRPASGYPSILDVPGDDIDLVDMEHAFSRPGASTAKPPSVDHLNSLYNHQQNGSQSTRTASNHAPSASFDSFGEETLMAEPSEEDFDKDDGPLFDGDTVISSRKSGKAGARADKLRKLMGDEIPQAVLATADTREDMPWFLRPDYGPNDLLIDPADGSVKGGTLAALVERLTAHELSDITYQKAFLITFKSFTTVDELVDLLIQRFWIQPPAKLNPAEREQWGTQKQRVVQARVLNILKSLVTEGDYLDKEDHYIYERIKEFLFAEEVSRLPGAKQLLVVLERAQKGGEGIKVVTTALQPAPNPIMPKTKAVKLKLGDIDPQELARQMTIFESQLFQKIRPIECLQRAREAKTESNDNITNVIQTSNRIAMWVAEAVLSKDDSRRRATTVKQLISVADRCRTLNNFSTMIAITSGLNTPPIRRLKRTWEQVSQRYMAQFGACEMTIDSNKNFNKYRSLMATVNPPCIPFIGVFLSTLQFIQDGNPDYLPGGLVNFRKRQKASEVINDIKRWQGQSFNFVVIPQVQQYIEESLAVYHDSKAHSDHFWELSLDREPREREDEKMARLLQESGFL